MTSFWLIRQPESSISMVLSDDNGGGRDMLWKKAHPRFFPREENIHSQNL